ncbi:MAG: pyrroline-5-carboxylate reductase, partial [Aquificota bacterium]
MHCSLIGVGKMGEAILKGLLPSVKKGQITLTGYEISPERKREIEEKYRLPLASTLEESITDAQVILIAVKPQQMKELLAQMGSKTSSRLLISIAAGIPSDFIQARVAPGTRIVRVMPNTPALIGEGALAYSLGPNTTEEDRETVRKLLT